MYIIIAKKASVGTTRGYKRENNHIVATAPDEVTLKDKLDELANEGGQGEHYAIVQVFWKETTRI
jgi:hypothetical protein